MADGSAELYRRAAELLAEIDHGLLERHLERCRRSEVAEIREIAADFVGTPASPGEQ